MKISGSLFVSNEPLEYAKKLKQTGIDYFHLDFMDKGHGLSRFEKINDFDFLQIPLDVHLISSNISNDVIETLNNSNTEILSVQYENLIEIDETIHNLKKFKKGFGFAISPNTDIRVLLPYKNIIKHILLMCSTPGVSGAKFLESSYEVIKQLVKRYPDIPIYIDGGIDEKICSLMGTNGVIISVFGSYLYKNVDSLYQTIDDLKKY